MGTHCCSSLGSLGNLDKTLPSRAPLKVAEGLGYPFMCVLSCRAVRHLRPPACSVNAGPGFPCRFAPRGFSLYAAHSSPVYLSVSAGLAFPKCHCFSGCHNVLMPSSPTPARDPACTSGPDHCPNAKSSAPLIPDLTCSNAKQIPPQGCLACTAPDRLPPPNFGLRSWS